MRLIALALGLAGWITYLILWIGVRIFGFVTLTFGNWGPSWVGWFELWIEPAILVGWIALLTWVMLAEIIRGNAPPELRHAGLERFAVRLKSLIRGRSRPVQLSLPLEF